MDNNGLPKIICIYPYEEQLTLRCEFFIGLWQDKCSISLHLRFTQGTQTKGEGSA
jgi:hypothetical protein